MKLSMYFNYTSRSLLRGGQRTILAIFCVAVGVMAVVSLQLVGFMLQSSLTANVRDLNGGDISVTASALPLKVSDLTFFDQLKSEGTITNYTAVISATGSLEATAPSSQSFSIEAVDPANFPVVSPPTFTQPNSGTVAGPVRRSPSPGRSPGAGMAKYTGPPSGEASSGVAATAVPIRVVAGQAFAA